MATKACLVTVGSTKFEALTDFLDENGRDFLGELKKRGINKLFFQVGKTKRFPQKLPKLCHETKIAFECFEFTKKFRQILPTCSLVISHAGAGSISETLSFKIPLLVVINETLMDNHQEELAQAMAKEKYLYYSKVPKVLEVLSKCEFSSLKPYPPPDATTFANFLDRDLGFT
ncbi:hypothetical protein AAMO2058_001420700 [Amorphochlora amoebiformis]